MSTAGGSGSGRDYRSPDVFARPSLLSEATLIEIVAASSSELCAIVEADSFTLRSPSEHEFISRVLIELARRKTSTTQRMRAVGIEAVL